MGKLSWTVGIKPFIGATTYYTDKVLSISYMNGRKSYLDEFTGNSLRVTLNNQTNVAASVVFDEVVCFGGWLAAPVALGVVGQQSSPVGEVGRVAGSFGHWLPPHFVRWVDASPSFLGLASSTILGCVGGVVPPTLQVTNLGSRIE